jgi:hypothetical protein
VSFFLSLFPQDGKTKKMEEKSRSVCVPT